jgi:archaellum component FlaD/FlaE
MRCRSARVSAALAARSRCAFPAPSPEQALQAVEREGAAEAERQRKIREEEERKQKAAEAERQRKIREEEERKQKAAEAERQRKIREEEERKQKAAEAERQRKIREEEERKAAAKVLFPATALPRPNVIRFAGCCRRSRQRQTRHLRSSG